MSIYDNYAPKRSKFKNKTIDTTIDRTVDKSIDKTIDKSIDNDKNYRQSRDKSIDKITIKNKNYRQSIDATIDESIDESIDKTIDKYTFQELEGIQRKLMIYIYNSCVRRLDNISEKISIKNLCEAAKTSPFSVKKSILRLRDKHIITKGEFKNGRGGWTRYVINKSIYEEMIYLESKSALTIDKSIDESIDKTIDKVVTQLETTASSSSSNIYNNKNTTTNMHEYNLYDLDKTVKLSNREIHNMIKNTDISEEDVQSSIDAFHHDYNNKLTQSYKNPKAVFLGSLKNGGYTSVDNKYKTDLDSYRMKLETMDAEIAQIKESSKELEADIKKNSFELWKKKELNTQDFKDNFEKTYNTKFEDVNGYLVDKMLQDYFEKNVWPVIISTGKISK